MPDAFQHPLLMRKERRESWNKDDLGDIPTFVIYLTIFIQGTLFSVSITQILEMLKGLLLFPDKQPNHRLSKPRAPVVSSF